MLASHKIIFSSYNEIDKLSELESIQLKFQIVSSYQYLYEHIDVEFFRENLKVYGQRKVVNSKSSKLIRKYWRSFIDEMTFPVFFDKLKGLNGDELYWFQKNKIVKKEKFLYKYRS